MNVYVAREDAEVFASRRPTSEDSSHFFPLHATQQQQRYHVIHQESTMSATQNLEGDFIVESDRCKYTDAEILSDYT